MTGWPEIFEARGTLQRLIAARLAEEVRVELIDQRFEDGRFHRRVQLWASPSERVVCLGDSLLEVECEPMRELIAAGEMGLGQILERLALTPAFELLGCDADADPPWRRYVLSGEGWRWEIEERFPIAL